MTKYELKKLEFIDAVDDIVKGLDIAENSDLGDLYDKLQQDFIDKACKWLDKRLDNYTISWPEDEYCWSKEMFLKQLVVT